MHDHGTDFDLERTLENHYRGIQRGEREHGLLLVSRLASNVIAERDKPPWQHVVSLDVYDPTVRPSPLFDHPMVLPLGIDYQTNPEVYRLGPEVQVGDHFVKALRFGVEHDCRALLALYFEPLLRSGASHLGIDISAPQRKRFDPDRFSSEILWLQDTSKPGLFSHAVESYFQPFFDQQRVVVLIRGDPVLPDVPWRDWEVSRAATVFVDDEAACRDYLDQLTAA